MSDSRLGRTTNESPTATPQFSNKMYDRLKYVALVLLPASSALYFGLGQIWGFPKIEEVIGTVAVIDTFLGMLLRQSNQNYKNSDARFDGEINVLEDEGDPVFSVSVGDNPQQVLEEKDEVTLKVNSVDAPAVEVEVVEPPKPRKRAPRKQT